jgi:hypothetical protein
MRNIFKIDLYLLLQQVSLLFAGGMVGVLVTEGITGWGLSSTKTVIFVLLIVISILIGLGYGIWLLWPWKQFNKNRGSIAIYAPYEVNESSASWVNIGLEEITSCLIKKGYVVKRTRRLFGSIFYPIIINPYGGAYPEHDLENFSEFKQILSYVDGGGIYVNIADIPFYFARTKSQHRLLDTTPLATPFDPIRSFLQSLLSIYLRVQIRGTDPPNPDRIFELGGNMMDLYGDDELVAKIGGSPFVVLPYGKGHFVFSTTQINKGDEKQLIKIIKEAKKLA